MGEKTNIGWTDATWNTIVGCSKVSDGCTHCYAESLALRYGWTKLPWSAPYARENIALKPQKLDLPLRWREPKMIFVNSLSDVFHEVVPDSFVDSMWAVMALAPRHTFQLLTKRPERMRAYLSDPGLYERALEAAKPFRAQRPTLGDVPISDPSRFPLPNVWLGTSVEAQREADLRIPHLLATPAAVRFLSCEPLLGQLDLRRYLTGERETASGTEYRTFAPVPRVDWVIVGGESGNHLGDPDQDDRWMDPAWARDIRDQCVSAGVAFFMKQSSGKRPGMNPHIVERDHTHTEWHQFPAGVTP